MKNIIVSLVLLCSFGLTAQVKVVESSSKKKPKWTTDMEMGFIVGIGKGADIQTAQDKALLQVKAQIVSSVADNIVSSSELYTQEITADKVSKQFESFTGSIKQQSAAQDFLKGISKTNVRESYWKKIQNRSTKQTHYEYYIKYPFDSWDLKKLVMEFNLRDQELTDELERTLARLDTFKSIEELRECKATLMSLHQYFIDQRKTKAQVGIDKASQLLGAVVIRNEGSSLGTLKYGLYIDNRRITFSARPMIKTPCAVIEDRKTGTEVCVLKYRYDECYGDGDETITVSYNIPEGKRAENTFYFDVNENKAELALIGTIRINPGEIDEEVVRNAICKVELSSKFDTPTTVTNITLEWKDKGVLIDVPINQTIRGKGAHTIEFEIPSIPMASVSTMLFPENKVNGSINYTAGSASQKIRIYQRDYVTGW